jgi:hypothetical protein
MYSSINDLEDIKSFMENHVFAVWDFMSLLKSLQRSLTCVSVPWMPRKNSKIVNFINQIVVEEESDDLGTKNPDNAISHYELYIKSMHELKASPGPIIHLTSQISRGKHWKEALNTTQSTYHEIPSSTFNFVENTFDICENGKIHEVASSFFFGRENPIPFMYINMIKNFDEKKISCKNFRTYLERHIEIDSSTHCVLAEKLLMELCGDDFDKWREVEEVAIRSIENRILLWDGVVDLISHRKNSKLEAIDRIYK